MSNKITEAQETSDVENFLVGRWELHNGQFDNRYWWEKLKEQIHGAELYAIWLGREDDRELLGSALDQAYARLAMAED